MSYSQEKRLQTLLNVLNSGRKLSRKEKETLKRFKSSMSDDELEKYDLY